MRFLRLSAVLVLSSTAAFSQEDLLKNLKWRNIGPANLMGRVADGEGVPGVPEIVYVGSASGGVFKTSNGGVTWTPLFDEMDYLSIGDLALEPGNPDVVYVGTGEGNPSNSVSFGNGIYKTTDGGKRDVRVPLGTRLVGDEPEARPAAFTARWSTVGVNLH